MELEKILSDPNSSALSKRTEILKEVACLYKYSRQTENVTSALKALELLLKHCGMFQSQRCSLKEMSDEDLEWLLT